MSDTRTTNLNPIRVDQNGYSTHLPKYVAVLANAPLDLHDSEGNLIKEYENPGLTFDEASGDELAVIELGEIPAGTYTLKCKDTLQRSRKVCEIKGRLA